MGKSEEENRLIPPTTSRSFYSEGARVGTTSTSLLLSSEDASDNGPGDENEKNDNDDNIGWSIISLAVPALAALILDPVLSLVDTSFVGRFGGVDGANQLAAMSLSTSLLNFFFFLFNFFCNAVTPLVSQQRAAGDVEGAVKVGQQALGLSLALGFALTLGLNVGRESLLTLMGLNNLSSPDLAREFFMVRSAAAPAVLVTYVATGILRGYLDTTTSLGILLLANAVNLALDILLIIVWQIPPAASTAAALATTTAEWTSALLCLGILQGAVPSLPEWNRKRRKGDEATETTQDATLAVLPRIIPSFSIPPWQEVQPLVVASASIFARTVVLQVALTGATAMAARNTVAAAAIPSEDATAADPLSAAAAAAVVVGVTSSASAVALAAHQIAIQLWLLCSEICDSLAAAAQTLVADAVGRSLDAERENDDDHDGRDRQQSRIPQLSITVSSYGLGLGLFLATVLGVARWTGLLNTLFVTDVATREELLPLLNLLVISQPLNAFVFVSDGILQGVSEFTYQAKAMAVSVALGIGLFFVLEHNSVGMLGSGEDTLLHVWYGLTALMAARAVTSLIKMVDPQGPIALFTATKNQ